MNDIEKLYINLIRLQELLKDREICSIRLVTIPEKNGSRRNETKLYVFKPI